LVGIWRGKIGRLLTTRVEREDLDIGNWLSVGLNL
jgi:hypothetical protein